MTSCIASAKTTKAWRGCARELPPRAGREDQLGHQSVVKLEKQVVRHVPVCPKMDGARKEAPLSTWLNNRGCSDGCMGLIGIQLGEKDDDGKELDHYPFRLRDDFLSRRAVILPDPPEPRDQRPAHMPEGIAGRSVFRVRPNENPRHITKSTASVDFVACDPVTMKPLFGIELTTPAISSRSANSATSSWRKYFRLPPAAGARPARCSTQRNCVR